MKRAIVTLAFGTGGCVTNYVKMQLFTGLGGCRNLVATLVFLGCEKSQPWVATGGCRMDSEVATYVSQLQPPTILGGWEV